MSTAIEGPLDLLLELARRQKVDLHRISILALAEQYLAFIEAGARAPPRARRRLSRDGGLARLSEVAAAPARPPKGEEPSAADLATALALRLRRLEAIRAAARRLATGNSSGATSSPAVRRSRSLPAPARSGRPTLYDLLSAYGGSARSGRNSRVICRRASHGLVPGRGARGPAATGRPGGGLDGARRLPLATWCEPGCRMRNARPSAPPRCLRCWRWCARAASSICARTGLHAALESGGASARAADRCALCMASVTMSAAPEADRR